MNLSCECLLWRCFVCFTCCFLSITLRGRTQIRLKKEAVPLKCTGVLSCKWIRDMVFSFLSAIKCVLSPYSFCGEQKQSLWYILNASVTFADFKWLPIDEEFSFQQANRRWEASAWMQIEFVQSSIKTVCLSSLPPVRSHSHSVMLQSHVANLSSSGWIRMRDVMWRAWCTVYWGHRT